jgi:CRP-like cAMP-binding protein
MHKNLFAYINQHTDSLLTKEEEILIESAFKPKKMRKKQYFLQEGEVCKYVGFIVKGTMRQYRVDGKGVEHTFF